MYAGQKSNKYKPGQVPGFNAPITVPGSASIKKGDILYSPVGVVHYFSAEDEGVYNFIQVHAYGEWLQLLASLLQDGWCVMYCPGLFYLHRCQHGIRVVLHNIETLHNIK
jgi:hypothetical protein